MKTWPFLLLLPLGVGAGFCTNSLVQARSTVEPAIESQSQLDDYALKNPSANLDKLGHAFGNSESRLFWNTDLEAAKRQAAREGKPILALRLLGKLSDEYSCANSRFFRVVFYPQSKINQRLRRDFVLYWSSERPVPVVTIDMGDGRTIKRTVTGNSIHYLLDSKGRPLDAFPGLATPDKFDSWLASAKTLAQVFKAQPDSVSAKWLSAWHAGELEKSILTERGLAEGKIPPADLQRMAQAAMELNPLESNITITPVSARQAAPLAFGKSRSEAPLVSLADGQPTARPIITAADFQETTPVLDGETIARIRAMNPLALPAQPLRSPVQNVALTQQRQQTAQTQSVQKSSDDPRFQTLIRTFEASLRADTRQNQQFSKSLHSLFAKGNEGTLDSLNRRVYDRLFLTPRSDQWLGLVANNAFSAIQNDGVIAPTPPTTN